MTSLISENLTTSLHEQIGHELYNSHLYLFICGYLRNKGLNNLAKHFMGQHDEEVGHAKEFFSLLTDLNADIIIPDVDGVAMQFGRIGDIATAYLNREILTTESIDAIKKLAVEESNPVVEEMCRKMISIQQKEYEEANDFMDKASLASEWWQVLMWDNSL
jgi:ferritin